MAWNEPGKDDQQGKQAGGPPELDKVFKDLSDKFSGLFGKKKTSSGNNGVGGGQARITNFKPFIIGGLCVLVVIWIVSGIFIVAPAEQAVILQFGKYQTTVGSGPHWIPRLIRSEMTINVEKISTYSYSSQMLTKDQNIVDVAVAVQYRINNARDYLFNVVNATNSVQQATASALRQVIGNTTLDQVLTSGRAVVRQDVMQQLESILQIYNSGIEVTDIALQPAQAPAEVKDAFDDAIKAQEDEQRYQNQAETYANGVVPIAQGNAQRITQEAGAYAQQVVLQAQADAAQFNAIYGVYKSSPAVTRERMYLTTIQDVLQQSSKIFVDTPTGNNNLLYLPLDKLMANSAKSNANQTANPYQDSSSSQDEDQSPSSVMQNINDDDNAVRPGSNSSVNPDSLVGRGVRP